MGTLRRVSGAIAVAVAAGALAAGCGGGSGDPELSIYLSAPLRGPVAADGRDIADGARLALGDAGREAGGVAVRLKVLDDAGSGGSEAALAGANARRATEDSTAIAYLGELDSGTTRTSLPITNEAGLLQVSPGASAVDLTREAPGSDQVPTEVQPSGTRTFGRVVPADTVQGAAAAGALKRIGIRSVVALGAESPYSASLLDGFRSISGGPSVAPQGFQGGVDGIYVDAARPLGNVLGFHRGESRTIGADAQISGSPPRTKLPPGSTLVSGPLAPSQLPAGDFADRFRAVYGHAPGRFAAYGYEAMAVALDAIDRADDPLDRGSVVDALFATEARDSILGTYSIDEAGDTTLGGVGDYRAQRGGRLEPAPGPLAAP
jgi:branched-chain amino acid transport system substrate-binding protein